MINIILAFAVGMLCGGFYAYSRYNKLWQWAMKTLRELDAKSMELRAQVEALRLFYGVKEDADA